MFGDGEDVLVAAPAEIHDEDLVLVHRLTDIAQPRDGVGWLKCRDNPLKPGAELEALKGFLVRTGQILSPARVAQKGVFRADSGIVETG